MPMQNSAREIIVRALIDGDDDGLMLVPSDKTDNPDECIHFGESGFEHVHTDGIDPVSKNDVRERADTWTIVQATPQ